jgi:AraC-like DNA-binding protein
MQELRRSPLYSVPSATGVIARTAYARLQAAGLPAEQMLQQAGLKLQQINDPQCRVGASAQIKLLQMAAEAMNDDLFGFHLSRLLDLRETGLIYYVLSSSGSFVEALQAARRYSRLVNEGIEVSFDTDRRTIALSYVDVDRRSDRHHMELWLCSMVRMFRLLTDTRIAPQELKVRHFRDSTPKDFREFLGCDVTFGADADEIILSKATISLPVVGSDRHLHELLVRYAEDALAHHPDASAALRFKVEKAIAPLLPHGKAKAPVIARELGLSPRTLSRLLAGEDLTFTAVLDAYRAALAKSYLAHNDLSISQIAWLLGYQEVAAFTHASNRWFGQTPRQLRAEMRMKD